VALPSTVVPPPGPSELSRLIRLFEGVVEANVAAVEQIYSATHPHIKDGGTCAAWRQPCVAAAPPARCDCRTHSAHTGFDASITPRAVVGAANSFLSAMRNAIVAETKRLREQGTVS
jgi:hypothetical protein